MARAAAAPARVELTLTHLCDLLVERKLISQEQSRLAHARESVQRNRLVKERGGEEGAGRRPRATGGRLRIYEPSPVEIVDSLRFPIPDTAGRGGGRVLGEDEIMKVLADEYGLPYRKLDPLKLDMRLITETLSRPFARRHVVLPLSRDHAGLEVALADPTDTELLESLKRITGAEVRPVLASKTDILDIITEVYGFRSSVVAAEKQAAPAPDLGNLEQLFRLKRVEDIEATDQHIVNAVEYLLHYAFAQRATDIHVEPRRDLAQIRLRIDGVLHDIYTLPRVVHPAFVSRIKILARLDIAERRRPQDGRIKTDHQGRQVELRVSTLPTAFGEKVVLRVFDPEVLLQDLSQLGFFAAELETYESFIARPNGLVLVTGPTGSGKTTTLYSTLRALATPDVNVVTVEDPIEMVFETFNQVAVQPKIDLTFAAALRNILRQDPDIVMVGEIRDPATAEMAVQAALTGHLVFSTLHTNDTASAVTRLQELGIKSYLIASTLAGVVAQRLVRTVCDGCRAETHLTPDQIALLDIKLPEGSSRRLPVQYGEGCVRCRGTGLYGRTGVFEVLDVTNKIRKLISGGADAKELHKMARLDGMTTLRESAIRKLALGQTSFEEIVRVTAVEKL